MKRRRVQTEGFSLGWICALHIELTAAKAALDEEYECCDEVAQYTLGRIGRHNVVIGCLPAERIGTAVAASLATEMQYTFPSLRIGVLVGIGGGVPGGPEADVRLGDVVISVPQGTCGGIIRYDFGKTVASGNWIPAGSLNAPPSVFLTAVSNLRANMNSGRSNISKHLSSITSLPGFARCYAGPDILFHSPYLHNNEGTSREEIIIQRPCRDNEEVVVHYGIIASGNQVIKDALERDRLSAQHGGVLCFEMEAAGLMNVLPCLVVRGICDYADSHKNKRWQPFSAAAAAACAKEVLLSVPVLGRHNPRPLEQLSRYRTLDEGGNELNTTRLGGWPILTPRQRKRCLDALKFE